MPDSLNIWKSFIPRTMSLLYSKRLSLLNFVVKLSTFLTFSSNPFQSLFFMSMMKMRSSRLTLPSSK